MTEMKKINILIAALALFLLNSCQPDTYFLNRKVAEYMISGEILSHIDSVEKSGENAVLIHSGGITSLRVLKITQLIADFTIEASNGKGIRFAFRTNSNDYPEHNAIRFDYTTEGSSVFENNSLLARVDSVKLTHYEPVRLKIYNDGIYYKILVDCDTVYKGSTMLPATEYVIIESLGGTEALLSGIDFAEIVDEF